MPAIPHHRYQHYKNKKTYQVLCIGYYTEADPLEACVVYQAEYDTDELGKRPIFIRPLAMFEETTTNEAGETVPRFADITDVASGDDA